MRLPGEGKGGLMAAPAEAQLLVRPPAAPGRSPLGPSCLPSGTSAAACCFPDELLRGRLRGRLGLLRAIDTMSRRSLARVPYVYGALSVRVWCGLLLNFQRTRSRM